MGFAYYVGHYLTGRNVKEWDKVVTSPNETWLKDNLQPGDYIRFGSQNNGHSAIVVSVSATGAELVQVNFVTMNNQYIGGKVKKVSGDRKMEEFIVVGGRFYNCFLCIQRINKQLH